MSAPDASGASSTSPVAVVLGASGGIGGAVAGALADAGHAVVRHHFRRPLPATAASALADIRADLLDLDAARALAADVTELAGAPRVVVNCVGFRQDGLLVRQAPDVWHDVLARNVRPAYNAVRAFLPAMMRARRGGAFVHVVSIAGPFASPGQTAYAASKSAIIGMTRSLAAEYGRRQITFNAVAPGLVDTDMTADLQAEVVDVIRDHQALPGQLDADAVADAVVFLARARSITGQVLVVDRGLRL